MEKDRRSVAEEAAARTSEAMERARSGKKELEDRTHQMALPEHREAESFVKEHPLEAALGALSLGFLLTRFLPLGALLAGLMKLGWMLLKPAALIYAGIKLAGMGRNRQGHSHEQKGRDETLPGGPHGSGI